MDENEKRAQALLQQADAINASIGGSSSSGGGGFFSKLFGGGGGGRANSAKMDEANELYVKAGNAFKLCKAYSSAGAAFCKAAQLAKDRKVAHESAQHLVEAANCYKWQDAHEAASCFLRAIDIYTEMGRFTTAAKQHVALADLYESGGGGMGSASGGGGGAAGGGKQEAQEHLERAADFYRQEDSSASADKCSLRVAHIAADRGQYDKAAHIFEQVGRACVENQLRKYGAKDHLFKAVLCQLCLDQLTGIKTLTRFEQDFPIFTDSREFALLKRLVECLEKEHADEYALAVQEYDKISRLDPWVTSRLLIIKKTIETALPQQQQMMMGGGVAGPIGGGDEEEGDGGIC